MKSRRHCCLHPALRKRFVVAREDANGELRLVAYLVLADPVLDKQAARPLDLGVLRQHLGSTLPEYMVPSVYVVLDALPLTANGKLDRNALPVPDSGGAIVGYVAPDTAEEILLCELVAELLGLERVGSPIISFIWAGTRCWRRGSRRRFARACIGSCRSARSLTRPFWASWPGLCARCRWPGRR